MSQEKVSGLMVSGRVESGKHKRMAWFTLVVLLVAGSGCSVMNLFHKTEWLESEGRAVKVAWEKPLDARLRARQEATDQARTALLEQLLVSRVDLAQCAWVADDAPLSGGVVRLMNLREADPVFSAQLNALVGELQPVSVSDEAEGELVVKMRLNRDLALDLVRASRLRLNEAEGR